jgi:hypothetical protein
MPRYFQSRVLSAWLCSYFTRGDLAQALPSDKQAEWREREEVQDLYSVYVGRQQDEGKRSALRQILGISEAEGESLEQLVQSGLFKLEQDVEEEAFF